MCFIRFILVEIWLIFDELLEMLVYVFEFFVVFKFWNEFILYVFFKFLVELKDKLLV